MNMQRALAASISVAEKWTTKENVLWLPFFGKFRQRNHPHVSAPHHALFLPVSTNVFYFYTNFISRTPLLRIYFTHGPNTSASAQYDNTRGAWLTQEVCTITERKEGRNPYQSPRIIIRAEPATYRSAPPRADRVIKATRCDWLLATTNVDFARTLHNFRLTDSIFESVRRLLSWSGQQHTNVLASLRPAYITQLLGVSRQIIRHLGVSRLMYARHNMNL